MSEKSCDECKSCKDIATIKGTDYSMTETGHHISLITCTNENSHYYKDVLIFNHRICGWFQLKENNI